MSTGLHCLLVGGIDYWQSAIVKSRYPEQKCNWGHGNKGSLKCNGPEDGFTVH